MAVAEIVGKVALVGAVGKGLRAHVRAAVVGPLPAVHQAVGLGESAVAAPLAGWSPQQKVGSDVTAGVAEKERVDENGKRGKGVVSQIAHHWSQQAS